MIVVASYEDKDTIANILDRASVDYSMRVGSTSVYYDINDDGAVSTIIYDLESAGARIE